MEASQHDGFKFKIGLLLTALTLVLSSLRLEFKLSSMMIDYLTADATAGALVAIGVCVSHKLADCTSIMTFLNEWAEFPRFSLDLANYFPAREFLESPFLEKQLTSNEKKIVTKRFVFDKEKLEALKQAATSPSGSTVEDPTSVEVVSAFIWKHFIDVIKSENPEVKKTFAASHAVSLRGRTSPCLVFDNIFGNCYVTTIAYSNTSNGEFHDLVTQLRSAIKKVNYEDYIAKAQTGDSYLDDLST
ncbi:Stemmadenine O-acetyltransferase [Sesamum alatum]|uniref:Stemmadenine O-acetyltransferase n=1 Tax=Sesamum alatum TaxID=300844 RepID=A0AAE2CSQ9_9LAMI|nr:Stemmadenine O-acetyltransferase [Sesamum alatum]